jgi:hypothetical protein
MAMQFGRVLTSSGIGIGTSASSANTSLLLFKNCVVPSYPYGPNLTSTSLSLRRPCLPEPKDTVSSTNAESKQQEPNSSSEPKLKSKSRYSRRGRKGKKKDIEAEAEKKVPEVEAEKNVPVPGPVQSSQSPTLLNLDLEDVNPVGLGRKSRQVFDEVWRKFSGLGQISRTPTIPANLEDPVFIRGPMCDFTVPEAQDTTVLVVGATSKIGRIVIRKLLLRGYNVKVLPFKQLIP